jgi:hypothetical protein
LKGLPALNEAGLGGNSASPLPDRESTGRGRKAMIPRMMEKQRIIAEKTQHPIKITKTKSLQNASESNPRHGKLERYNVNTTELPAWMTKSDTIRATSHQRRKCTTAIKYKRMAVKP